MASCVIITAIICVLITTVAVIVAFATPNWIKYQALDSSSLASLCNCPNCDCGMWLYCTDPGDESFDGIDNCYWFFSDNFRIEKQLPDWFKAVQGLMSCAVATSLMSLIIALFTLCCYCKGCNPHQAAGAFITLTFLLIAAAVSVFGAKAHLDHGIDVLVDDNGNTAIFSWSFWVAAGAGGMALFSSVLYCCVGRNDDYV